jgi:hypothetical protein
MGFSKVGVNGRASKAALVLSSNNAHVTLLKALHSDKGQRNGKINKIKINT